ncbi:MAG: tetratricopeptide repeat protein [Limisphaerales bacterium]
MNRFDEAATHFRESLRLDPDNPETHYLLALALACQGGIEEVIEHVARAVALQPGIDTSVTVHELLAENLAKAGRFAAAIQSAERALQLARSAGKNDLAERIAARLARYRNPDRPGS